MSSAEKGSGLAAIAHGIAAPIVCVALAVVFLVFGTEPAAFPALGPVLSLVLLGVLLLTVAIAVHHAETIAHRLGEPYGTLVLTMAVTVIECSLILAVMLSGKGNPALARDTVFSVFMLVMNGLVGLCFLIGGLRWGEQTFRATSARSYLMVLLPFGVITMVLPGFTTTAAGPFYSTAQIIFVSIVTLALYGHLPLRPDGAPSRLLRRRGERGGHRGGRRPRAGHAALSAAGAVARRHRALRQELRRLDRVRSRGGRGAAGDHRRAGGPAGAPAGERRGDPGGARGSAPALDQSGARFDAGDDRPDLPGGRRPVARHGGRRSSSGSGRPRWCCWR